MQSKDGFIKVFPFYLNGIPEYKQSLVVQTFKMNHGTKKGASAEKDSANNHFQSKLEK